MQLGNSLQGAIDTAVVVGRKDMPLLNVFLKSFAYFSRLGGRLLVFHDKVDRPSLLRMPLPRDSVLIDKQEVAALSGDGYRDQMLVKLNVDRYSAAPYVWMVDCDFLITRPLFARDFFEGGKPVWLYRDWDNPASLVWRDPTQRLLKADIPFQFMDRPQYLLSTELLKELRRNVQVDDLGTIVPPASEYTLYASFCYARYRDAYVWHRPTEDQESLTYSVNQRPPSYHILDPDTSLGRAGSSKVVVFWSHWDLAEAKMKQFLSDAVQRHCEALQSEIDRDFLFVLTDGPDMVEQVRSSGLIYEDLWIKPDCKFLVEAREFRQMLLAVFVIGDPDNAVRLVVGEGETAATFPLAAGENELRVDLPSQGQHHLFAFEATGGVAEMNGSRLLSARLSHMSLV